MPPARDRVLVPAPSSAVARFERLEAFTAALSEAVSLARVAAVVVEKGSAAAEADAGALVVLTHDQQAVEVVHASGHAAERLAGAPRLALDAPSPLVAAVRTREPAFVESPLRGEGTWAALPLTVRNRTIGAVGFLYRAPRAFDDEMRAFLLALARQAALAIERAQLHDLELAHRREAEEESERFRSLVQELDAVFWEADPVSFNFSFVSQRAEAIVGYPIARWYEAGFWPSIIHPDDRSWAVGFCADCTKAGQDHTFEYRLVKPDGKILWVRDVVYVVRDRDGAPSKLRGVMVDITREREGDPQPPRVARVFREAPSRRNEGFIPTALRLLTGSAGGTR